MSFQDAASMVASRLKVDPPISAKVIDETQSALRVLKFKNPNGIFGKGDNDLKRACAMLEYVARERQGVQIPMAQLAKAAYTKEREFVKFHQTLGNFRSQNKPSKDKSASSNMTSTTASTRKHPSQQQQQQQQQQSSIPSLAIKLGSFVANSNGLALRAQRLYNQMLRFYRKNPDQIRDMTRFRPTYEAVCFYLMAITPSGGDLGTVAVTSKTRRTAKSSSAGDDEGEGKPLQITTVVDLCPDVTKSEFEGILEHVQSILQNMQEVREAAAVEESSQAGSQPNNSKKRKAGLGTSLSSSSSKTPSLAPPTIPKRSKEHSNSQKLSVQELASHATNQLLQRVQHETASVELDELVDDPFAISEPATKEGDIKYAPQFLEWKRQVLAKAIHTATGELRSNTKTGDDHAKKASTTSREQALAHAVGNLLKSRRLLVR